MQSDDAAFFAFFFAAEMTGQKLTGTAASGLSAVTGKDFSQLVLCARVSAAMSNNRTQLIGKSYYCITAIFQTIFTIYRQGRSFAVYFAVSFHERILGTKVAFFSPPFPPQNNNLISPLEQKFRVKSASRIARSQK